MNKIKFVGKVTPVTNQKKSYPRSLREPPKQVNKIKGPLDRSLLDEEVQP